MSGDVSERSDAGAPGWVTLAEAAAVVGVSSKTIRRAVKAGTVAGRRAGEAQNAPWLVRLADVEARWGGRPGTGTSDAADTAGLGETSPQEQQPAPGADAAIGKPRVGERLSELRRRLVPVEPERRWWQRQKS